MVGMVITVSSSNAFGIGKSLRAALAVVSLLGICLMAAAPAAAQEPAPAPTSTGSAAPEAKESKSFGHRLLFWIPNRVFDVLDIVRLRVRAGPGMSLGVRATEAVDLVIGAHATIFAGLHGPRSHPQIPWPIGLESMAGVEVSVLGGKSDEGGKHSPQYGPFEIGAGFQALIVGLDIGIEPFDVVDFALGILTLDPKGDDY
jgi:hypothetical protein